MLLTRVLAVFLICALAVPVIAQPIDKIYVPDTAAGKQLRLLLAALESGDHEAYIRGNLFEAALEQHSVEDHLRFFRQLSSAHGSFEVHAIESSTDTEIDAVVRGTKSGKWRRIVVQTQADAPYKVAGLGIDMAEDPTSADAAVKLTSFPELDSYLKDRAAKETFSGVVLVARDGEPVFEEAYGFASKRFGVPNRVDTKFNIGSINKGFTSVAIRQLVEQGKVKLDDTISEYLDGFPEGVGDGVTVEHLLNHESGWGAYWGNEYYLAHWSELRTMDDYMAFIRYIPLDFEPGTGQQYSNTGYEVLGAIVEKASGQNYYDYIRDHVYAPAGMTDSDSYDMDTPVENLAIGYMGGEYGRENTFHHSVRGTAAGGGYSTARDLLNFTIALHQGKLLNPEHSKRYFGMGIAGGSNGINAAVEDDVNGYTIVVLCNFDPPLAEKTARKISKMVSGLSKTQ